MKSSTTTDNAVNQLLSALSEPPIPTNPADFMAFFYYSEIEDETGQMPAALEHIGKVGYIPLSTRIDEGVIILSGKSNPDAHPIHHIPIAPGHKGGMTFQIKSNNQNRLVRYSDVWKRTFTKNQMETLVSKQDGGCIKMEGHCPQLPYGTGTGHATITLEERRGSYFIQEISIEMDFKTYDAWVWAATH